MSLSGRRGGIIRAFRFELSHACRLRRVAIVLADGRHGVSNAALVQRLIDDGVVPCLIGQTLGFAQASTGELFDVDVRLDATAAVLDDALVVPGGYDAVDALGADGRTQGAFAVARRARAGGGESGRPRATPRRCRS